MYNAVGQIQRGGRRERDKQRHSHRLTCEFYFVNSCSYVKHLKSEVVVATVVRQTTVNLSRLERHVPRNLRDRLKGNRQRTIILYRYPYSIMVAGNVILATRTRITKSI